MNGIETVLDMFQNTNFYSQLFATIIGAFTGFMFAIILQKWNDRRKEKTIKRKIIDSLISEINQIKDEFSEDSKEIKWISKTFEFSGKYSMISLTSFDNALYSGNLALFPTKLQIKLSLLRDIIRQHSFFNDEIHTFYKAGFLNNERLGIEAQRLINYLNLTNSAIKKDIEQVYSLLKSERKKL